MITTQSSVSIRTYLHTGPELPLVEQEGATILVIQHTEQNRYPDVISNEFIFHTKTDFHAND